MNAKGKEIAEAITREVENWTGLTVDIVESKGHPKAKLKFGDLMMTVAFSGTPGSSRSIHHTLADVRRTARKLGAERVKPDPSPDDDEAEYRKRNPKPEKPAPAREPVEQKAGLAEQIGDAAAKGAVPPPEPKPEPVAPPKVEYPREIADGIYFDMPEDAYHAIDRMSGSNIKSILVSPADFWRDSWLNPSPPVMTDEQRARKEIAKVVGDAYHKARLQPELFEQLYARQLAKADMPDGTLFTGKDMAEALSGMGQAKSGSVAEQAERLIDCGWEGPIWQIELARWHEANKGRIALAPETFDDIHIDGERLRDNPEIAKRLEGGQAEVSIFWTPSHGIPMKARLDYLTAEFWSELKTFANPNGKHVMRAMNDAIQYNRYYVSAAVQREAVEQIRVEGLPIVGEATDAQRELIAKIQIAPSELELWFIFQQKGGVPNIFSREFRFYNIPLNTKLGHAGASDEAIERVEAAARRYSKIFAKARAEIESALREFHLYGQVYRRGQPWFPIHCEGTIDDLDFSDWWLDGRG